jgi:hypothetical protein
VFWLNLYFHYFNILLVRIYPVGRVAQSVYILATGWKVRRSNPGGGEVSYCMLRIMSSIKLDIKRFRPFGGHFKTLHNGVLLV